MPEGRKIATCCYCGTRAILVFDRARHELTCQGCGAPLHNMKSMPQEVGRERKPVGKRNAGKRNTGRRDLPQFPREAPRDGDHGYHRAWHPVKHKKTRKKRKPMLRRLAEEIWDEVEDIFD
ncbi:hypothetical protein A3731_17975 [Roseovarius sp. HI0049]|nr:hypothetical protein A3731_17975 [Roseovarius sp. HI0049]